MSRAALFFLLTTLLLGVFPHPGNAQPSEAEALPTLSDAEHRGRRAVEVLPSSSAVDLLLFGGTILTGDGKRFERGYVLLQDGSIAQVGEGDGPARSGIQRIDLQGAWVTPGLIDTHSHLGVYSTPHVRAHSDGNEATAPTTAGVWAEHSFWPQDPGLVRAVAGGVTALQILPGSANLIGGRGVVLQMRPALGSRAMRFPGAPETVKMACGENPKRVYGQRKSAPSTRMGNLRSIRTAFLKAAELDAAWERWDSRPAHQRKQRRREGGERGHNGQRGGPDRNLDLETLVGVLRGDFLAQVHCYRADDMISILQLADEFGFRVRSFHHALEAYKIRDLLAEHEVASSTWADWWGFKLEAWDGIPQNAALLTEAGAKAVIHSDSATGIQRLNQEAAKALWAGRHSGIEVTDDQALQWITLNPAWALGIDHLTGSITQGKRGDLVIWDGDPFSIYSQAKWVFVEGRLVYDIDRPRLWSDFEAGLGVQP